MGLLDILGTGGPFKGHVPTDPSVDLLAGTPIGELLAEKQRTIRSETVAAERQQREDAIARALEPIIADELRAAHERDWPSEIELEVYKAAVRNFTDWARERGLGVLPASSSVVAFYLLGLFADDLTLSPAELKQVAKAIAFAHDLKSEYLDGRPIAAALEYIEEIVAGFIAQAEAIERQEIEKGTDNVQAS